MSAWKILLLFMASFAVSIPAPIPLLAATSSSARVKSHECFPLHKAPDTPGSEEDPVIETTVSVVHDAATDELLSLQVQHRSRAGNLSRRDEEYGSYAISVEGGDESATTWKWSGVLASNPAFSMTGRLMVLEDETAYYIEEMTSSGKLEWVAIWTCYSGQ
jgi:hypothetical protein